MCFAVVAMGNSDFDLGTALAALRDAGVIVDPAAADRLTEHARRVAEAQPRLHLVSDRDVGQLIAVHTLDCCHLARHVGRDLREPATQSILDIGSGGGFPGLVLACLFPGCPVTLLDRSQAKAGFLRLTAQHLDLPVVTVLEGEFPGAAAALRPTAVTARAVERPPALGKHLSRWMAPGAVLWCQSEGMLPAFDGMFHVEPVTEPPVPRAGLWRVTRNVPRGTSP